MKYILIEGVDLAGKTTVVSRLLAKNSNWQRCHGCLVPSNPILSVAKSIPKDGAEWIGHLYAEALAWDLKNWTLPTVDVLQDSTILLRSLAFNATAGFRSVVEKFERMAFKHPKFSFSFLLTASMDARIDRLKERIKLFPDKVTPNDLKIVRDPSFFQAMETTMINYAQVFFNPVIIDTTSQDADAVVEQILSRIGNVEP